MNPTINDKEIFQILFKIDDFVQIKGKNLGFFKFRPKLMIFLKFWQKMVIFQILAKIDDFLKFW